MVRIVQDSKDWQAGFNAGSSGGTSVAPPEIGDRLAYFSGFIEGKVARSRARAAIAGDEATDDRSAI
jgi:hypothetical protein